MKRSLALIIISILLAHCSSEPEQTVVNVASDIIPKSQVVWCNNEISKLQAFIQDVEDGVDIPNTYTKEIALDLYDSYQYFTTTSNLIYGAANSRTLLFLEADLNVSLDKYPLQEEYLYRGADFCTTWYQAQNS
jgi:uncharacterized protein YcfL